MHTNRSACIELIHRMHADSLTGEMRKEWDETHRQSFSISSSQRAIASSSSAFLALRRVSPRLPHEVIDAYVAVFSVLS